MGIVLPVVVVQMLTNESVRLHSPVVVHLRHVHVISEKDEHCVKK